MEPEHTIIGVDIGGTKVAAALLRGRLPEPGARTLAEVKTPAVLERFTAPTDGSSAEACLRGIRECLARLVASSGHVDAIGVGVASCVDYDAGRVVHSVNLPLGDVPLRDELERAFGVPVALDNDATAATVGEHTYGAGVGAREMLMLTLGTGVGGGIVCGGRPYRGASGAAAELGHLTLDVDGPECPADCSNRGCLEAYVAGPAMGAAARAAAEAEPGSGLGRALAAGEPVDGPLLSRLALAGDPVAVAVLALIGALLGAGLTTLVNIFNPELIVIGGGAAQAGELLFAPARRVIAERALPPARDQVRLAAAALGPDAGVIGASALALAELAGGEPGLS
jgi:glucokinase